MQEIRFLSLVRIDGNYTYLPNGITYTFLLISFVSCNIYICYELNDFLLYFIVYLVFSFDVIIIALFLVFVNTFLNFIFNILFIMVLICFKTIIFSYFHLISDNLFN